MRARVHLSPTAETNSQEYHHTVMGAKTPAGNVRSPFRLFVLAVLLVTPVCGTAAQEPAAPEKLPFTPTEQEAYLDGLIRNAPRDWAHGKNWVLIKPYLLGRNVTSPIARTVCPDAGLSDPTTDSAEVPAWVYVAPGICDELAATHDAALVVLEDPSDANAAYFVFLACDAMRRKNPCDMDGYYQQDGMKLEESEKHGRRKFNVLVPDLEGKNSRFLMPEIWHMREVSQEPTGKE